VTALATGFAEPAIGGVVVAADGVAYTAAYDAEGVGGAWRVDASGATLLATGFALGEPAGVALTPSGGALLVSSERADEYAQVVIIDLATGDTSTFDDVIGVNQGAGGLHRARDGELFAWIDRQCRTCAGGRVTSPKGTDSSQVYLVYGIE
jgi:DNA-binding beta-propeller fold protein YncE